ncbi:GNAT family N-acetyltransferase [Paraglaciecola sp. 2405UD69-4]|uniref:GNAT family N-acetyltransferase n=1 Tax=Paraglaciecola sp. 2405UD69-4 TaxID=3391836 RepID=UPI0039C96F07
MHRFEYCNGKTCAEEMLALGQINMKMWYLFSWLSKHEKLQHGTQAEVIKLYVNQELVAYSVLENYQGRTDKETLFQGRLYQDLGVVHFVTLPQYRNKGYASLLANKMYQDVIQPLLSRHNSSSKYVYVTATKRAVPLMERTGISDLNLVTEFYSDTSFEKVVASKITPSKH